MEISEKPLVSVVIPVYNGANYLGEAIESVLAQTWPNIEIVIVDDGSTDGGATRAVAAQYGSRVRYILKPNGGVATALNAGIQAMRGELFSWLSHDDVYKPEKIARQVDTLKRFAAPCVVIGDFETMNAAREPQHFISMGEKNLVARPLDAIFCGLINGCALLVPRYLFDQVGSFEPGLPTTQDYHLWYRIARLVPFVHCPHSDVRQRMHELQGSRTASHMREASRMFAYLLDQTPAELMEAYDGSPLGFLLKVREALAGYPGLFAYLQFRIHQLLKALPYSVLLCSDGQLDVPAAVDRLRSYSFPPREIVNIDFSNVYQFGGRESLSVSEDLVIAFPEDVSVAAVLLAAEKAASTNILVFLRSERIPSETQFRAALETLMRTESDIARPADAPIPASPLDGLVLRRDVISQLLQVPGAETMDWDALQSGSAAHVEKYPLHEPFMVATGDGILRAFNGQVTIDYNHGISDTVLAELLLYTMKPELPTILLLAHSLGGGTKTHLTSLVNALATKANCIIGLAREGGYLHIGRVPTSIGSGLVFRIPEQLAELVWLLRKVGVRRVDVHHTFGFETETEALLDALGVPFDMTLLDYHQVATNPHLASEHGLFVGDAELLSTGAGIVRPGDPPLLHKAARVIAISRDLAQRVNLLCPGLPLLAALHWDESSFGRVRHVMEPGIWGDEPLRVLLVGRMALHKGRNLVAQAAALAYERDLPVQFHVMGQMDLSALETAAAGDRLVIHGFFADETFHEQMCAVAPHVGWLPSLVPETWSYVLSDLFEAALPVAATALGSFRERCFGRPFTWLLPWDSGAERWLSFFVQLRKTRLKEPPIWDSIENLPPAQAIYFEEYLHPAALDAKDV